MKKVFASISLISLVTISTASARSLDLDGSIRLRDGRKVVRINVGGEDRQDSSSMIKRIKRLERAVRALQDRVYDLEDETNTRQREVTIHTCTLATSSDGMFIGKGKTKGEAIVKAVSACKKGGGFPCRDYGMKSCETSTEYVNN